MARAPKGAKVPKKRGLFGFLGTEGAKWGWETPPKPPLPGVVDLSNILTLAPIFAQRPPLERLSASQPTNPLSSPPP
jgi:hypothetical protein